MQEWLLFILNRNPPLYSATLEQGYKQVRMIRTKIDMNRGTDLLSNFFKTSIEMRQRTTLVGQRGVQTRGKELSIVSI